jgi:3-phenylpropionate/trans-cinnamate dioxygenase ferredoxin reductase subunit
MIDDASRVVIVGAGHGGTAVAALLRQGGFTGRITVFGAERHLPYHRPPLSKTGTQDGPELLRPAGFYADQDIELRLDSTVAALEPAAAQLVLDDGERIGYDVAVLATGAQARRLRVTGAGLEGIHTLRTLDDAAGLRADLGPGRHVVIVGGGYVGLEIAAVARQRCSEVTVLEGGDRLLGRSAGPDIAAWLQREHGSRGTRVSCGVAVTGFRAGPDGRVASVHTTEGDVTCDLVLLGVGAEPRDELARTAGLHCHDGVMVDEHARTSAPGVYAVGDLTRRPLPPHPGLFRLESIPSAGEQAKQAVAHILGAPAPRPEVPWFWSDQFQLKLQIAGLPSLAAESVVRGDRAEGRFAVYHLDPERRLVSVEAVNAPGDFMAGKRWIGERRRLDATALADAGIPLRELVKAGEP